MKKVLIICILVFSGLIMAQEETLLDSDIESGGFGGPAIKFSSVQDKFAVLVGGYGGWIINHTFVIGAAGYGLANKIDVSKTAQSVFGDGRTLNNELGYGGLYLEYINKSDDLIHFTVSSIIGAGAIVYNYRYGWDIHHDDVDEFDKPNDVFFVLEPTASVELNIARFFRLDLNASYRYITGVKLEGINSSDLSAPTIGLSFKFGKF